MSLRTDFLLHLENMANKFPLLCKKFSGAMALSAMQYKRMQFLLHVQSLPTASVVASQWLCLGF